jgi:hypothetical protein
MNILPELTKNYFEQLYTDLLKQNAQSTIIKVINNYDEILKKYKNKEKLEEELLQLQQIIYKFKYATLIELKMLDYIKKNNPNMVLKLINKKNKIMNEIMEIGEEFQENYYLDLCNMAKDNYNRYSELKNILESLQS